MRASHVQIGPDCEGGWSTLIVVDRSDKALHFSGWKTLMEVCCVTPGTVESCVELLKQGEVLCIAPGGVREALFSDSRIYNLMWRQRFGFVKIAMQTRVVSTFNGL